MVAAVAIYLAGSTSIRRRRQAVKVRAAALIGRARELNALRRAVSWAVTGEGGVVVVRGDAGLARPLW
jgi:hypothetical protein